MDMSMNNDNIIETTIEILLTSTNAPINLLSLKYTEIRNDENEIVKKAESITYNIDVISGV